MDWHREAHVDNDISAKSGKPRAQFERLVADIESGDVDGLVSVHLDLTTASGRLLARILASAAAAESEQKGERVRSARRQEAMSGHAHTALGYGYNSDRSLNPVEVAVIKDVAARLLAAELL